MICFPNGKINLGLRVTHKRSDGYHDLDTVFVPVVIHDALEFRVAANFSFRLAEGQLPGNLQDNTIVKAYELLKKKYTQLPALEIILLKHIPHGAGLGGGSSDASFFLASLNSYFNLGCPSDELANLALKIGSDCPFFLLNKPAYATSRGELLTEIALDVSDYNLIILKPGIHISTGWAFSQIQPSAAIIPCSDIVSLPIASWKDALLNDFEVPVFSVHPELKQLKQFLYDQGAVYASMSGSGSSLFAFYEKSIFIDAQNAIQRAYPEIECFATRTL